MVPNRSIFDLTHKRHNERLVQGVLLYLLENDEEFSGAFCAWLDFPSSRTKFAEEGFERTEEQIHRHDLVATFEDGSCKNIELKLWADWTFAQRNEPGSIDIVILPRSREKEAVQLFGSERVRTWEDLVEQVAVQSQFAKRLLDGLKEYAWMSQYRPREFVVEEIEKWKSGSGEGPYKTSWFLDQCYENIKKPNLSARSASKMYDHHGYWGQYIRNETLDSHWTRRLWFGFIFDFDAHNKVNKVAFVLQACDNALAVELDLAADIATWYPWPYCSKGLEFEPSQNDAYTVESWKTGSEKIIEKYAAMSDRAASEEDAVEG